MKALTVLLLAALTLAANVASAQTASAAKPPVPTWLAPDAEAQRTLAEGLSAAQASHRRIVVLYEGTWCGLCAEIQTTVREDPDLPQLLTGFVGLHITAEDFSAVQQFARSIHANLPKENAVLLTLLDFDGSVLTTITAPRILENGHISSAKLKAMLMEWFPGAPAEEVFKKSLPALAASGKSGWVEFRADWCGWCKKMEKMFQQSDAAPILAKYYTVIAVDTEKNEGSEQLSRRLGSVNGVESIPWFAVIDARGKVLATSEGPKGNIGYPDTDVEVAHFFSALKSTAKGMTASEIETITKAIRAK